MHDNPRTNLTMPFLAGLTIVLSNTILVIIDTDTTIIRVSTAMIINVVVILSIVRTIIVFVVVPHIFRSYCYH